MIHLIFAMDKDRGLGYGGDLAWRLKEDMKFFKEITTSDNLGESEKKFEISYNEPAPSPTRDTNIVIMGRKTWESIPPKFKPLPNRKNVVLSQRLNLDVPEEVSCFASLEKSLATFSGENSQIFIIGGSQIYKQALEKELAQRIYITQLDNKFNCDVFAAPLPPCYQLLASGPKKKEGDISFQFQVYQKS